MSRRLSFQFMLAITVTLVFMLSANLYLVWLQQQRDLTAEMHSSAKIMTQHLISTRLFIARNQERINKNSLGHFEFKGLNPAAVGRGVGAIMNERTGTVIKQTRFQVRRVENAPDTFEWEALTRFSEDRELQEFWKRVEEDGKPYFRYAVPLKVERECLACHGEPAGEKDIAGYPKEGLKEGDLGGAISVSVPMAEAVARLERNAMVQVGMIILITAVTLLVIYLVSRYVVTSPLERLAQAASTIGAGQFRITPRELETLHRSREMGVVADSIESMARSLHELYTDLEKKVAERTRDLEQANQLQGQFLATVSHELRTPLTSIIAFSELLLKQANPQQQEYLQDVLESSRRLLDMVNNLLDLSRLKAGRIELFTDVVELPPLLASAAGTLRPLAERKGVLLRFTPDPGLPPLMADPHRVLQVLLNLGGNAIKFTPEGGEVVVTARAAGGWVEVNVADTGPGVAPEHRETVFEAFRRVEGQGNLHPGSGLGLAISRSLVELHGGRIWADEPATGVGSLFRFTLPVARIHDKECEAADAAHQEDPGSGR